MCKSKWIEITAELFYDYLRDWIPKEDLKKCTSVEQVIYHWLSSGKAVEACSGDYRIFLSAVAIIFADWHDWCCVEGKEHCIPSHITRARSTPRDRGHGEIFDPYAFISFKN